MQLQTTLFSILLTFYLVKNTLGQTNYCDANLCKKGKPHIACNNNGNFQSGCSKDAKIITLTPQLRQKLIRKHNALRNRVAVGNLPRFEPAVRMATMVWSPELAKMAEYNVKQCRMQHDKCRNTSKFPFAGQNIAISKWSGKTRAVDAVALEQLQNMFDEYKLCSMAAINNLKEVTSYGHFTAMVQEKSWAVGCAIMRQTVGVSTTQLMTCDYAFTNMIDSPVYRAGPTASKCTTGTNANFKGLCSPKEKYNVSSNKF